MRRLSLGTPPPNSLVAKDPWLQQALRQIEEASYQDPPLDVADAQTINGTLTEQRAFDAGTGTLTDIRNVLATFLHDLKKRGSKKIF